MKKSLPAMAFLIENCKKTAFFALVAFCITVWINAAPATALETATISIQTKNGETVDIQAEIARTDDQRARGLMFRKHLAPRAGMWFPNPIPKFSTMWMKNTLIPLDMIFVSPDHRILYIHENAEPGSLDAIGAPAPVIGVLEIAGGQAAAWGITAGDRVILPDPPAEEK